MGTDNDIRGKISRTSSGGSMALPRAASTPRVSKYPRVVVPSWRYEAFQRWFVPADDRDGVNIFVGRAWRAPGT